MRHFSALIIALLQLFLLWQISSLRTEGRSYDGEEEGRRSLFADNSKDADFPVVKKLKPIKDGNYVMFWRPQKVGSSTLLSILMSYGYRFNQLPKRKTSANTFCRQIAQCALNNPAFNTYDAFQQRALTLYVNQNLPGSKNRHSYSGSKAKQDNFALSIPWKITLSHEICNLNHTIVEKNLVCAFEGVERNRKTSSAPKSVNEIFMVRDPLSRAVSVYYFWGELYKLAMTMKKGSGEGHPRRKKRKSSAHRQLVQTSAHSNILGAVESDKVIDGSMFRYHGSEKTVPPDDIALDFARNLPYRAGMPGPSFTWSAFANDYIEALDKIKSDGLFTVVLERLDESLVALSHYLNWTLADVVVTKQRKALSQHPKVRDWPLQTVSEIKTKLEEFHEFEVYNASVSKLDERIAKLKSAGVDVDAEVQTLKSLRNRVTKICLDDTYLEHYRETIQATGLPPHPSNNKLREVEQKYQDGGHLFSFNREIIISFDICGSCEAHALLLGIKLGLGTNVDTSTTLKELPWKHREGNENFVKCPKFQ